MVGALFHLFLARGTYVWELALLKQLWTEGRALQSGGAGSGLLALALAAVFSKVGAGLVFVLAIAAMALAAFHITPAAIVDLIRSRPPRAEYEEEPPEPEPRRQRGGSGLCRRLPPWGRYPKRAPSGAGRILIFRWTTGHWRSVSRNLFRSKRRRASSTASPGARPRSGAHRRDGP